MLALLGLLTIVALFVVILTKRMAPLVARIAIPVIAALVGGCGLNTSKFRSLFSIPLAKFKRVDCSHCMRPKRSTKETKLESK